MMITSEAEVCTSNFEFQIFIQYTSKGEGNIFTIE